MAPVFATIIFIIWEGILAVLGSGGRIPCPLWTLGKGNLYNFILLSVNWVSEILEAANPQFCISCLFVSSIEFCDSHSHQTSVSRTVYLGHLVAGFSQSDMLLTTLQVTTFSRTRPTASSGAFFSNLAHISLFIKGH